MKITIATVGTRGDVQPYIALAMGLQSAGHQVQIATDPLFQSFIENHGLGFAAVNADPRQAMQKDMRQIGGNPLMVRTGALYHDVGKMSKPLYFIENLSGEYNPHDELPFEESARIIIDHVRIGVEIAKKHRLPDAIIDFIRTHHGTTIVQYFYKSYLKKFPEDEADLSKFTYPGPKPFSREMAVLMMADSVEASSRSLKVKDEDSLKKLVEQKNQEQSAGHVLHLQVVVIKPLFLVALHKVLLVKQICVMVVITQFVVINLYINHFLFL